MHISKINYTESQSTETLLEGGLREWNKKEYSVSVSLNETDDENKADELAKQFVKEKLGTKPVEKKEYIHVANENPIKVEQVDKEPEGFSLNDDINNSQSLDELASFKMLAYRNPESMKIWKRKYDELLYHEEMKNIHQ